MRKSPLMKENIKTINSQKLSYLNKSKQKTSSLEKTSHSNRSLLNEIHNQTPNQPKKNISTQQSDQKLHNQGQILKSLMKIQNRTNPILTQQNCYAGVKLNFTNCITNEEKRINTNQYNSLNQTVHPSPKAKTISLSTYTSLSPELREKELRQEKITTFKQLIQQTKQSLENTRIQDMHKYIEKIFDETIQPLIQLKVEVLKQIEKSINAEQYQIRATIDSLKKMEEDILCNEFNIIEAMSMGPFNDIMSIYQKRFKEHSMFSQQLIQQELIIHQFQQLHENFSQQNQLLCKQLAQTLQTHLSLYISFQNKEDFYDLKDINYPQYQQQQQQQQQQQFIPHINQQDNLFQTCETNNSIDEDQVITKDQQVVRIPDKTSQFTQLLLKGLNSQKSLFPSESPQFKN